jgi:hypothetical protein
MAAGASQKLHGKNGAIYIGGPKGTGAKVTTKTEWTLNLTGAPILIAYGPGLIDASITAANNDAIKASGNFRAAGAWAVFTSGTLSAP